MVLSVKFQVIYNIAVVDMMASILLLYMWSCVGVAEGCSHISSSIGGKMGERGGEVEEVGLVLGGRLMRPPNEPSSALERERGRSVLGGVLSM